MFLRSSIGSREVPKFLARGWQCTHKPNWRLPPWNIHHTRVQERRLKFPPSTKKWQLARNFFLLFFLFIFFNFVSILRRRFNYELPTSKSRARLGETALDRSPPHSPQCHLLSPFRGMDHSTLHASASDDMATSCNPDRDWIRFSPYRAVLPWDSQ